MGCIIFLPEHFIRNMVIQGCRLTDESGGPKIRFLNLEHLSPMFTSPLTIQQNSKVIHILIR